jgi:phosphohistidine phosphatase
MAHHGAMQATRRLIVMRHAKSGDLPGGPDAERALNPRGRRDAAAAGDWLRDGGLVPDLVLCSAARRARQTWQQISAGLAAAVTVREDPRLYEAGSDELLEIIRAAPPDVVTLMYVGHNPAAQDLAAGLLGRPGGFPTAAIAVVGLAAPWASTVPGEGELLGFWTPRAGS